MYSPLWFDLERLANWGGGCSFFLAFLYRRAGTWVLFLVKWWQFSHGRFNWLPKKWLTSEIFNPTFTLTDSAVSSAEGVLGVDAGGGGGGASPLPSPLAKKKRNKYISYSFKIFFRFWLAKSTRTIHHNQLLMTKFERILR